MLNYDIISLTNEEPLMKRRLSPIDLLEHLCIALFVLAFLLDHPLHIFQGFWAIVISPDILLTDYIEVGGLSSALINASLMGYINIKMLKHFKSEIKGLHFAAVLTIIGFSFIGKNLFNFFPIYLGGIIYTRYHQQHFNDNIIVFMFATALSPIVSELTFGTDLPFILGLFLGIFFGILIGFIIVPVSSALFKVHEGYNLYNVGLAAGLIGTLLFSLLRSFNLIIKTQNILSTQYSNLILISLCLFSLFLILWGIFYEKANWHDLKRLLSDTGQSPVDFFNEYSIGASYINMGLVGFISVLFVYIMGGSFNGPIIAGIFTIIGFAASGKHAKNIIPIFIGVYFASIVKVWDQDSTVVIIAGLFGTTLAPISGEFGILAGILAGFLHLSTVMNVGIIHGGTNLYNNGFAGGIVGIMLVAILKDIKNRT